MEGRDGGEGGEIQEVLRLWEAREDNCTFVFVMVSSLQNIDDLFSLFN